MRRRQQDYTYYYPSVQFVQVEGTDRQTYELIHAEFASADDNVGDRL